MKKIVLSLVLLNLLAACASNQTKDAASDSSAAPAKSAAAEPTTGAAQDAQTATSTEPAQTAPAATSEASGIPDARSVFFPFDVDAVQANDRAIVQAHGAYLGKNTSAKVKVAGFADERGSSEYNLALGQRRANNVKKLLVLSGAKGSQVETVSYGEEKPRCAEHNESCWSQNRRGDINYK